MASNYLTYADQEGKGANQSVGTIAAPPLPTISPKASLDSVKLTFDVYRSNGTNKDSDELRLEFSNDVQFAAVHVPRGTTVSANVDLTSYVQADGNGNLSFKNGSTYINLHGWHNWTLVNSTWKTTNIRITAYYTPHTHSYTSTVTIQPNCVFEGVRTYTCSCGDTYTELIPVTGHTEVTIPAVAPTCTTTGLTEGKKCSVCGTIITAQQIVAALGHSYTSTVVPPTESSHGYTRHTCSRCGDYYDDSYTYLVRWYNEDGSVLLETDPSVPHGTMPECSVTPTKPATAQYSYTHAGWAISPTAENTTALTAVVANIKYYARFTRATNTYTVTWKNDDGTVLETDTLVPYGDPPDYNRENPTKASTAQYDYTFLGWSAAVFEGSREEENLPTVTGNIVYTAVYLPVVRKYDLDIITYDCTVEGAVSGTYEYGTPFTIKVVPNFGYEFVHITDVDYGTEYTSDELSFALFGDTTLHCVCVRAPAPIFASSEQQVKDVYIVPVINTIVYTVDGDLPTLETTVDTVDNVHFAVINTAIENSVYDQYLYYSIDKLFVNDATGKTTRIW